MAKIKPHELRARQLFLYMNRVALESDPLNAPGAVSDATLLATLDDMLDEIRLALHAGKLNKTDQFDPGEVATLTARASAHLYAIARNNGILNDIDLAEISAVVPATSKE